MAPLLGVWMGGNVGRLQALRGLDTEGCEAHPRMPSLPWRWTPGWRHCPGSMATVPGATPEPPGPLSSYRNWEVSRAVTRIKALKTEQTTCSLTMAGVPSKIII